MRSRGLSRREWLGLAAVAAAPSCIPDGRLKRPFHMRPLSLDDGWVTGTPADVGLDPAAVEAAFRRIFDEDQLPNIRSMLVARHGVLVAEAYVADAHDVSRLSSLMSATKAVTSLCAGIALQQGRIPSLDVTVGEALPGKTGDAAKQAIRLRDLLTMRSGIDFPDEEFSIELEHGDHSDSVAYVLSKPLARAPGTKFEYRDATAHLAGAVVERAAGQPLDLCARDHIFGPAGIKRWTWLHHQDGSAYGAWGLFLVPRDFLRLGREALRAARHEASAIVEPSWIDESTSPQVEPDFGDGFDYGYYWWLSPTGEAFTAVGHGGQFAYVVPSLDLVTAITADPNSNGDEVSVRFSDARSLVDTLAAGAH